MPAESRGHQ